MKDEAARSGRQMSIAVAGCVAQGRKAKRSSAARLLSMSWSGPQKLSPSAATFGAGEKRWRALETEFRSRTSSDSCRRRGRTPIRARGISSFSHGARKAATSFALFAWCVHARRGSLAAGRKNHRRCCALADNGVREITLIGQNVNAYSWRKAGRPASVLEKLLHAGGNPRRCALTLFDSHPRDVDDS